MPIGRGEGDWSCGIRHAAATDGNKLATSAVAVVCVAASVVMMNRPLVVFCGAWGGTALAPPPASMSGSCSAAPSRYGDAPTSDVSRVAFVHSATCVAVEDTSASLTATSISEAGTVADRQPST